MAQVGVTSVTTTDRGVRVRLKVLPMLKGFIVQRVEYRAIVDGENARGGWTESWTVSRKPRKIEGTGDDDFAVPVDWMRGRGEMTIQAIAWWQRFLPDGFVRVANQDQKWGRLRGTDEMHDPPEGAKVLQRVWTARWENNQLTTNKHLVV